ncbi:hypothetical membrane protein [Pelotomaculum thermopropionicum SI]|uniref:Hypothetical membrane protein n=1 Tax=Pelotomaculum thermopropionicum (strain DSM 13744 / JCM 10971 / SI) TaxID=370438 RepID=A5D543_PELTS|nr:hypothetical membrane protein [Pelotomaculum thermopropionicum SI]
MFMPFIPAATVLPVYSIGSGSVFLKGQGRLFLGAGQGYFVKGKNLTSKKYAFAWKKFSQGKRLSVRCRIWNWQ